MLAQTGNMTIVCSKIEINKTQVSVSYCTVQYGLSDYASSSVERSSSSFVTTTTDISRVTNEKFPGIVEVGLSSLLRRRVFRTS